MSFWDIFKKSDDFYSSSSESRLQRKILDLMPKTNEDELIKMACLSGLLARVAYVDFIIHESELENLQNSLKRWTKLTQQEINAVSKIAIEEIKDLSGLENHKYTRPLSEMLSIEDRYSILVSLFSLSASDGSVSSRESEEIRVICKGLLLEHKHFISAQATVKESLDSLK
ncbi:TerB family tellurite resistance protein [bacterium]|nr:TerB family tellurite resistance protein [bacterium]